MNWSITVHSQTVEVDDVYYLKLEKALKNARNFNIIKSEETGIDVIVSTDFRCFSHTFNVNDKFVVAV